MNDINELVKSNFDLVWNKEILSKSNLIKTDNPKGYVLGGQPGAGKSRILKSIGLKHNLNIAIVNADDYRKYHPNYLEFQEKYGKDSPKYTALFSAKMTESIIQKVLDERYNIAIEGTFRTYSTPINTLQKLKDKGYETIVSIQTCNKETSWNSCLERYNKAYKEEPSQARYTDKAHHDLVVANLASNIKKVYDSGLVDNMEIYFRHTNKDGILKQYKFYDSTINKEEPKIEALNKLVTSNIIKSKDIDKINSPIIIKNKTRGIER